MWGLPATHLSQCLWLTSQDVIAQFLGESAVPLPLSSWQLAKLQELGLPLYDDEEPDAAPASAATAATAAADESSSNSSGSGPEAKGEVKRVYVGGPGAPVDWRLLAALRVLLLRDDGYDLIKDKTPQELGDWSAPIARQHEVGAAVWYQGLWDIDVQARRDWCLI